MQGVDPVPHANDAGTTRHQSHKALKCGRLEAAQAQERKGKSSTEHPGDRWPENLEEEKLRAVTVRGADKRPAGLPARKTQEPR